MNEQEPKTPSRFRRSTSPSAGNARDAAYQLIRSRIIHLDFKPGEALSDKQLAEEMDMSRTPVREALILLAASNMVVLRPQIGTFVAPIDTARMEMEQFARFALEKEILARACPRLTEEHRWCYEENLRSYLHYAGMEENPERADRLLELDNAFHRIAFAAAGREDDFEHLLRSLHHVERMRMLSVAGLSHRQTYQDHETICTALLAGDLAKAQAALELHFNRYKDNLPSLREKYPAYFSLEK